MAKQNAVVEKGSAMISVYADDPDLLKDVDPEKIKTASAAIQSATDGLPSGSYSEHSLDEGSTSRAASYVGLAWSDGSMTWGAGTDTDIIVAGIKALVSAINSK